MAQGNVQGMQLRFPHDVPGQAPAVRSVQTVSAEGRKVEQRPDAAGAPGAIQASRPVESVDAGGSLRAVLGDREPGRTPMDAGRVVPGGAGGDAGGDLEACAGASGRAAAARAGGSASGAQCVH